MRKRTASSWFICDTCGLEQQVTYFVIRIQCAKCGGYPVPRSQLPQETRQRLKALDCGNERI